MAGPWRKVFSGYWDPSQAARGRLPDTLIREAMVAPAAAGGTPATVAAAGLAAASSISGKGVGAGVVKAAGLQGASSVSAKGSGQAVASSQMAAASSISAAFKSGTSATVASPGLVATSSIAALGTGAARSGAALAGASAVVARADGQARAGASLPASSAISAAVRDSIPATVGAQLVATSALFARAVPGEAQPPASSGGSGRGWPSQVPFMRPRPPGLPCTVGCGSMVARSELSAGTRTGTAARVASGALAGATCLSARAAAAAAASGAALVARSALRAGAVGIQNPTAEEWLLLFRAA